MLPAIRVLCSLIQINGKEINFHHRNIILRLKYLCSIAIAILHDCMAHNNELPPDLSQTTTAWKKNT
jgi:hypothetical protein